MQPGPSSRVFLVAGALLLGAVTILPAAEAGIIQYVDELQDQVNDSGAVPATQSMTVDGPKVTSVGLRLYASCESGQKAIKVRLSKSSDPSNSGQGTVDNLVGTPSANWQTVEFTDFNVDQGSSLYIHFMASTQGGTSCITYFRMANGNPYDRGSLSTNSDYDATFKLSSLDQDPDPPSNPSPANGAQNQPASLTLTWTGYDPDGPLPLHYDVFLSTSNPPYTALCDDITTASCATGALSGSTTYYWQVNVWDNANIQTELGPVWSFTTEAGQQNQPPYAPSAPSPSDGATNQANSLTLTWTGGDPDGNALTYSAWLDTTNPPQTQKCGGETSPSCATGTLNPSTTYYWKVRSHDAESQTDGPIWSFTTTSSSCPGNPPAASNPNPSNGATGASTSPHLSWDGDACEFTIYLDTHNPPATDEAHTHCPATTNEYCDVSGLAVSTLHYWRVYSWNAPGQDNWGTIWSFTTEAGNQAPNTPSNPTPSNGEGGQPTSRDLLWDGGDPDGDTVTYDVWLDSANPPTTLRCNDAVVNSCWADGLAHSTTYFWKVRSSDGYLTSTGPVWSFTTEAASNSPPNPAQGPVPLNQAQNQETSLTLRWTGSDPNGDPLTYDVFFGTQDPPTQVKCADIATESCASGTLSPNTRYYWRVDTSDASTTTNGPVWNFKTANEQTLQNGGEGPSYTSSNNKGKYFSSGVPTGTIVRVCAYFKNADQTLSARFRQTPSGSNIFAETWTSTQAGWNCKTVDREWSSSSLFVYKYEGAAEVGVDTNQPYDAWSYNQIWGWETQNYRYGYKIVIRLPAPPNGPPSACYEYSKSGLTVTTDAACSSDPDADPLTYAWTWGDGATSAGVTASHTYGCGGDYAVELRVTDPSSAQDIETKTVSLPVSGPDGDNDGLVDCEEATYATNAADSDTDDDGVTDGTEVHATLAAGRTARHVTLGTYAYTIDKCSTGNAACNLGGATDPTRSDTDADGLSDGAELNGIASPPCYAVCDRWYKPYWYPNPNRADTDGDNAGNGLDDKGETEKSYSGPYYDEFGDTHTGVSFYYDATDSDRDQDFLKDGDEYAIGANPFHGDMDRDLLLDGAEKSATFATNPHKWTSDADGVGDHQDTEAGDSDPPMLHYLRAKDESYTKGACITPVDATTVRPTYLIVSGTNAYGSPWNSIKIESEITSSWVSESPYDVLCVTFPAPPLFGKTTAFTIEYRDQANNAARIKVQLNSNSKITALDWVWMFTCWVPGQDAAQIAWGALTSDPMAIATGAVELGVDEVTEKALKVHGASLSTAIKVATPPIVGCLIELAQLYLKLNQGDQPVLHSMTVSVDSAKVREFTYGSQKFRTYLTGSSQSVSLSMAGSTKTFWQGQGYTYFKAKHPNLDQTNAWWNAMLQDVFDHGTYHTENAGYTNEQNVYGYYVIFEYTENGRHWTVWVHHGMVYDVEVT